MCWILSSLRWICVASDVDFVSSYGVRAALLRYSTALPNPGMGDWKGSLNKVTIPGQKSWDTFANTRQIHAFPLCNVDLKRPCKHPESLQANPTLLEGGGERAVTKTVWQTEQQMQAFFINVQFCTFLLGVPRTFGMHMCMCLSMYIHVHVYYFTVQHSPTNTVSNYSLYVVPCRCMLKN